MLDFLLLMNEAQKVSENAYSPYSSVKVGAALLCENGRIFTGCNVENSSYGATVCAERAAVCAAVSAGERNFTAIAISANIPDITPCGICRQFISEFSQDIIIVTKNEADEIVCNDISKLLPEAFSL